MTAVPTESANRSAGLISNWPQQRDGRAGKSTRALMHSCTHTFTCIPNQLDASWHTSYKSELGQSIGWRQGDGDTGRQTGVESGQLTVVTSRPDQQSLSRPYRAGPMAAIWSETSFYQPSAQLPLQPTLIPSSLLRVVHIRDCGSMPSTLSACSQVDSLKADVETTLDWFTKLTLATSGKCSSAEDYDRLVHPLAERLQSIIDVAWGACSSSTDLISPRHSASHDTGHDRNLQTSFAAPSNPEKSCCTSCRLNSPTASPLCDRCAFNLDRQIDCFDVCYRRRANSAQSTPPLSKISGAQYGSRLPPQPTRSISQPTLLQLRPMQVHLKRCTPREQDAIYNARYKTEPCLHYQRHRRCPLEGNCHFAHGPQELRQANDHPKYRTRPCKNFFLTGICPFGSTCFFQHHPPSRLSACSEPLLCELLPKVIH
ncbi:unnamed protein product [Protopolystoma xenopodis]|uniref:C3H1-type domain-containing protein n=1 Tax=Protopolystoma xenopodis TaxID=117903 RepID=A0A3S5CCF7_9PLAT|nr:unnamed protein product [Protopolystoma xenopodis]